jgi:superfamily II DNA or RNA helicase/HJR/Mrr/RecB family endonuclease
MSHHVVAFTEVFRYRLGKRLSRIAEPPVQPVSLGLAVSILTTNPVEYEFPEGRSIRQSLLDEERTFSFSSPDVVLAPSTQHQLARLLVPDKTIPAMFLIEELPIVFENLFEPLGKHTTGGKHFKKDTPAGQQSLFADFGVETQKTEKGDGSRKGLSEKRADRNRGFRKDTDVWDLLLPLLQPPIDHNFVDVLDLPPRCSPHPYQWEGIKFLVERQSALLGDDMGTGKTVQSILASRLLFQRGIIRRALIVSPLSVLAQWDRELEKWAPSLKTTVVRGTVEHRKVCWSMPAHVWITTYDTLRQDIAELTDGKNHRFELVILDEAQRIKNRSAGISQAVRKLESQFRWALSGTPIENRISDLAAIFAFLKPGLFPGHDVSSDYARELITPYFLRRRKEDVLKDLKTKEEFPIWLRLGDEQQRTYNKMEKERVVALHEQEKEITAHNIVTLIGELKKICNRDPVTGTSAKLDWLQDNIPDICESGNKVLIFTQYRQEQFGGADWLAKELSEFGTLNYGEAETDRNKQEMLGTFEHNPQKYIFLGNPRTAGLGLNQLVAANYVVHFDHWWNPAVTKQGTARAHRPNQTKDVFVYHLWIEDTIEELVLQKTLSKQRLYDEVIDSLSAEITEDVLFDIYDDLLEKHGFKSAQRRKAKDQLQSLTAEIDPRALEELVGRLFETMGFTTRVTQYSRDGGVDVIATREVGASIEKLAIQCKRQSAPVGRPALQQLLGVLAADPTYTRGILITTAEASRDALDLVRQNGRLQIVTGREFEQLLEKHRIR